MRGLGLGVSRGAWHTASTRDGDTQGLGGLPSVGVTLFTLHVRTADQASFPGLCVWAGQSLCLNPHARCTICTSERWYSIMHA